ncbi:MAG: hypothetical protein Q9219_001826 [cf. Caloplaca sp. 3 TL-2023]
MSSHYGTRGRLSSQSTPKDDDDRATTKPYRQATVYDAVAGRISSTGFIPTYPHTSNIPGISSASYLPLPPEEVLSRRRNAPERYEEDDIYWAHEDLNPTKQQLPGSELLKAIHEYASDFYTRVLGEESAVSWGSLDETALLAVGILLEEEVERVLGETGDLVFVEGKQRVGDNTVRAKKEEKAQEQGIHRKRRAGGSVSKLNTEEDTSEDEESPQEVGDDQEATSPTESPAEFPARKKRRIQAGQD